MFNFLNFPAIRFKKASLLNTETLFKIINQKFVESEEGIFEWEDACYDSYMSDDKSLQDKFYKESQGGIHWGIHQIFNMIQYFTLVPRDNDVVNSFKNTALKINSSYVKDIIINENDIIIKTFFGSHKVEMLSAVEKPFENYINITTEKRYGTCHDQAIGVASSVPFPSRIATGYLVPFCKRTKYLHSWVEVFKDGKWKVIDTTQNIITDKKSYYELNCISGPVYKITKETFLKEKDIYNYLAKRDRLLGKLYLSNRHQAIQVYNMLTGKTKPRTNQNNKYNDCVSLKKSIAEAHNDIFGTTKQKGD